MNKQDRFYYFFLMLNYARRLKKREMSKENRRWWLEFYRNSVLKKAKNKRAEEIGAVLQS